MTGIGLSRDILPMWSPVIAIRPSWLLISVEGSSVRQKGLKIMQTPDGQQSNLFDDLDATDRSYGSAVFNKDKFMGILEDICIVSDVNLLKNKVLNVRSVVESPGTDVDGLFDTESNCETVTLRKDVLTSELNQILEAQTADRAKYYLKRLQKGVQEIRTNKINDINLYRWKEYDNVITDSLWVMNRRDTSGGHLGWYWGNFIPQIPHQMMLRYTKRNDWVLDTFVGSGTTLIECRRLARNGVGIELNEEIAKKSEKLVKSTRNEDGVVTDVVVGDNRTVDIQAALGKHDIKHIQFLIMHPPYHDIIQFSEKSEDLSNAHSTEAFLQMFGETVDNATPHLETGRYFALVIGDKYCKGEWIPLGFYCMAEVLKRSYSLKSIIVKNFEETRAKRNQTKLWRYRALVGGFYVFKHEYILLFKKEE